MLAMEDILCELVGDDMNQQGLPPGFRFHPTDEELITFYLASKVLNGRFCRVNIAEVDLNRCEPWELPDAAKMGEREWYFFSLRDRKYPTGLRTNRATCAGYWKATGKDREVYGSGSSEGVLLGMKKTLVFYKGRAPRGEKTKWVMHEYRLDVDFFHRHSCKEEWVICRIFHKIGEKKNLLLQGQSHLNLIGGCSSQSHSANGLLPPLLEAPSTLMESQAQEGMDSLQNPLLMHHNQQGSYLIKSFINPVFSHFNLLPLGGSPFPSTTVATTIEEAENVSFLPPTTIPLKSLENGHEKFTFRAVTNAVSKHCKTEACIPFSHSSKDNMIPFADEAHQSITSQSQAPPPPSTPFWADNFMGFPLTTDTVCDQMPVSSAVSSVAFNRAGFQCF